MALRVMVPGLAGMSGLRYRTFLVYNVASAVSWGTMSVLFGYLGGNSWRHVEHVASRVGLVALAAVVVLAVVSYLLRHGHGARLRRLVTGLGDSVEARRVRTRFPRTTAWMIARLDATSRTGLGLTTALAVAVASTWTFLGITQDVVGHEELARLDPNVHAWILLHRDPSLNAFLEAVTWLGASVVTVPLLLGVGGILARRGRSWAPLRAIVVVYGVAVLLRAVVAPVVHRVRPPATDWLSAASGWAYPSGHTTQAVAAWGVLALVIGVESTPRVRVLVGSVALAVGTLVAASRVYLGVHWLTDVLGAATLSTAVLSTWYVAGRTVFAPRGRPLSHRDSTLPPLPRSASAQKPGIPASDSSPDRPKAVVVIPTYDEADNVLRVIEQVRSVVPEVHILVVDDNSPDGTAGLVAAHPDHAGQAQRVYLLRRTAKDGLGSAYRAGFTWALARDYDVVVQMDADLSHPPQRIPALLEALATADVAIGSRYIRGGKVSHWSPARRLISWAGNTYVRLVLGLRVRDTTAGFKAFRSSALEAIGATASSSNGYCFQIENTWRSDRLGLRIKEVPITFTDRTAGTSKMSGIIVAEALSRVLVWRWHELVHRWPGRAKIPDILEDTSTSKSGRSGSHGRAAS